MSKINSNTVLKVFHVQHAALFHRRSHKSQCKKTIKNKTKYRHFNFIST